MKFERWASLFLGGGGVCKRHAVTSRRTSRQSQHLLVSHLSPHSLHTVGCRVLLLTYNPYTVYTPTRSHQSEASASRHTPISILIHDFRILPLVPPQKYMPSLLNPSRKNAHTPHNSAKGLPKHNEPMRSCFRHGSTLHVKASDAGFRGLNPSSKSCVVLLLLLMHPRKQLGGQQAYHTHILS